MRLPATPCSSSSVASGKKVSSAFSTRRPPVAVLKFGCIFAASVLSLPPALVAQTLVLTSSTLGALTLLVPSPTNPAETIQLSAAEWNTVVAGLKSEGAAVKEQEFFVKVAGAPYVTAARST